MKQLIGLLLLAMATSAHATASYLGTINQDVSVTSFTVALPAGNNHIGATTIDTALPAGANAIGTVGVTSLPSIPAGANAIGTVGVTSLPALVTGTANIGTVTGSSVTSVLSDDSGNHVSVTANRLNVNASFSGTQDVSVSTVGIRGSQGTIITSKTQALGTALLTVDSARANLDGLSLVYKSSDSMIVGGAITLTGKANQVDLSAIDKDCTFNIAGGDAINVAKNTAESYNFDYTATNLTVNLTAKTSGATCKVRITGAN